MKLPVNFEQFKKNPIAALAFLMVIAVGYLYIDNRISYTRQIEKCDIQLEKCEVSVNKLNDKLDHLEERLRRSDSTLSRAVTRLEVLNELGVIK
tara:strand:- start:65 stop:346 length:282 start_codon:yes stop_codon:yes gene_type:complete